MTFDMIFFSKVNRVRCGYYCGDRYRFELQEKDTTNLFAGDGAARWYAFTVTYVVAKEISLKYVEQLNEWMGKKNN